MTRTTAFARAFGWACGFCAMATGAVGGLHVQDATGASFAGSITAMLLVFVGVVVGCVMIAYIDHRLGVSDGD